MTNTFNLKNHNEFYARMGWTHGERCVCRRTDLPSVAEELARQGQRLEFGGEGNAGQMDDFDYAGNQ